MDSRNTYVVPQSFAERSRLRELVGAFMSERPFTPPLSLDALYGIAEQIIEQNELSADIKEWLMVDINNHLWKDTVATTPRERCILLLPKCLSNSAKCRAQVDELGLLCRGCKSCSIDNLQQRAEELGVMSLVAEGFTSVVGLVENNVVDAIIGVGCLDSLSRAFPMLIDNAIPGLAIPLNCSGCKDTTVDAEYVNSLMSYQKKDDTLPLDYSVLKSEIKEWFSPDKLSAILDASADHTSIVSGEWLAGEGGRWRPYLLAATYLAISGKRQIPEQVMRAAIAVECFHKASLVHDDIQDNDATRYGRPTVCADHGVPVAINVGDMLLGYGYSLLAECGDIELLKVAAEAHKSLCRGQGMELEWTLSPRELTMDFVFDIFRNKTVPAFDVAICIGAICAEADNATCNILHKYSTALGIAYQLQDDADDFSGDTPIALRPSAVIAKLCELSPGREFTHALLQEQNPKNILLDPRNCDLLSMAVESVRVMSKQYRQHAFDALGEIENPELKRLLFRVTSRILK